MAYHVTVSPFRPDLLKERKNVEDVSLFQNGVFDEREKGIVEIYGKFDIFVITKYSTALQKSIAGTFQYNGTLRLRNRQRSRELFSHTFSTSISMQDHSNHGHYFHIIHTSILRVKNRILLIFAMRFLTVLLKSWGVRWTWHSKRNLGFERILFCLLEKCRE
jgi:hypothetical protein